MGEPASDYSKDQNECSELAERNLAALRTRYREYADVLSCIRRGSSYSFETREDVVLCRDVNGTWLHGPDNPRVAASTEAEQAVREVPELFIVLRPGLGYLAFALDEVIGRRSQDSVLLIVEDRLELFRSALTLVDWTPVLGSPRSVLLLGRPPLVIGAFLERHPELSLLPPTIVASRETSESREYEALMEALPLRGEKAQGGADEALAFLGERLTMRRTKSHRRRILIATEDLGYLAGPIAEGFRVCGCEVELNPAAQKRVPYEIRARDRFRQMVAMMPDLVLWANRPELYPFASDVWRKLRVANVLWTLDSPPRLSIGSRELGAVDLHLCFDPTYLPVCAPLSTCRAAHLSLAAGLRPLSGCSTTDAKWPDRAGPDVAFVGSRGDAQVGELRLALWAEDPECARYLDELTLYAGDVAAAYQEETGEPYAGLPCFYVDAARSALRRTEILSRMPPSSLKIFGSSEWLDEGSPFAANYGGLVRYGPDLARLYFHARINLNVFHAQCVDSTNSRVYDVLAAGGFLLSEDRPVLHREFEVGRHLVTFSTAEEATEKVAYYLAHPTQRETIAREGQRHVLAHHTFQERCERLLALAEPFMG